MEETAETVSRGFPEQAHQTEHCGTARKEDGMRTAENGGALRAPLLQAEALHKSYGAGQYAVKALDGVDLEIKRGELLVILGSSGSGKSTLLNMLGGMDRPDSGTIRFRGKDISRLNDRGLTDYRRRSIGFIFQSFNLIAELTVRENVALTADTSRDARIVDHTLDMLGLSDKKNSYPNQLSGGQQQRTAIARALAGRADLLLCDEPTGALDYDTGKQILIQLEALAREQGKTVVIVTHTQEIGKMADRVVRMRDGRIIAETENRQPIPAESIEW
jgi:putative ABC transport system ATP-binding protein